MNKLPANLKRFIGIGIKGKPKKIKPRKTTEGSGELPYLDTRKLSRGLNSY